MCIHLCLFPLCCSYPAKLCSLSQALLQQAEPGSWEEPSGPPAGLSHGHTADKINLHSLGQPSVLPKPVRQSQVHRWHQWQSQGWGSRGRGGTLKDPVWWWHQSPCDSLHHVCAGMGMQPPVFLAPLSNRSPANKRVTDSSVFTHRSHGPQNEPEAFKSYS